MKKTPFLAIYLDQKSKELLLKTFPLKHSKVFAEHVTLQFKPTPEQIEEFSHKVGKTVTFYASSYAEDDDGQAVGVEENLRLDGKITHIAISSNVPPVCSLELLEKSAIHWDPIQLSGTYSYARFMKFYEKHK